MPKVKELGVTVVPEGFGPVGIGGGAACGNFTVNCLGFTNCGFITPWQCRPTFFCTDCTTQPYSICGTTPGPIQTATIVQQARAGIGGCTDCTTTPYSICGTSPGGCTDCTTTPYSICGTSPGGCTDCTTQPYSICGTTPKGCTDCTTIPYSICGTTPAQQRNPGLTVEGIKQLRAQLNAQLAALDEHEKSLGPQTEAEIDAREKEINDELAQLRSRRDALKKK